MRVSPLASLLAAAALAVIGILTAGVAPAKAGPVQSVEGAAGNVPVSVEIRFGADIGNDAGNHDSFPA